MGRQLDENNLAGRVALGVGVARELAFPGPSPHQDGADLDVEQVGNGTGDAVHRVTPGLGPRCGGDPSCQRRE